MASIMTSWRVAIAARIVAACLIVILAQGCVCVAAAPVPQHELPRWTEAQAREWYAKQPWLVGSNYLPAYAANELEMWQAETFDPKRIDLELGWAESLGFNTMRVFFHDLLWEQDADGFKKRIDTFLAIAARHHIRPIFVLFDSCWDPNPQLGKQPAPRPGVHNSRWVQSPGAKALQDPAQYPRLAAYVKGIVGAFAQDPRVLAWDVWNEPDNTNEGSYGDLEPKNKVALVLALLAAGIRVGARGASFAAVDQRRVERRLVFTREIGRDGENPDRDV